MYIYKYIHMYIYIFINPQLVLYLTTVLYK